MSAIVLSKVSDVTISLDAAAIADRDAKLTEARSITSVEDAFGLEVAADAVRELAVILKSVEKARTEVKAPVLELGRKIDALAKEFLVGVETESRRINLLVNAYQSEQQRKREAEERARQRELQRIEDEKRKQEAEIRAAKSEEERKAKAAELATLTAKQTQATVAIAPAAYVPEGVKTKKVWRFEVENIRTLVMARPELCRIQENTFLINKAIAGGMIACPGLRIWEETSTRIV